MDNNELYHYGVLGMKWGVRKNPQKAYTKAAKKLKKLDSKLEKQSAKVDKATDRYDRVTSSTFVLNRAGRTARAKRKLDRATRRYTNTVYKGTKWYESMEKTFAKTSIKFDPEVIESGRAYAEIRRNRRQNRLY